LAGDGGDAVDVKIDVLTAQAPERDA